MDNNFHEIGWTGLKHIKGYVFEEPLTELSGLRGIKVFSEMSDNDSIIGGIIFVIQSLVKNISWSVKPCSSSEADMATAQFILSCMHDMEQPWSSFIDEVVTSVFIYGWAFHEMVFKMREKDRRIGWKKLSGRSADSLVRWEYDEAGRELIGMLQQAPPNYSIVTIPIEKSILFRSSYRKNNPQGRSSLRNAYRPWFMRKNVQNMEGIHVERDATGIPVGEVPGEVLTSEDPTAIACRNAIQTAVKNIRVNETAHIIIPSDRDDKGQRLYDVRLLQSPGQPPLDTGKIIDRYSTEIAMTVIADFIKLGHDSVGSYALADTKTNMFCAAIGGWLKNIVTELNRKAVPMLVDMNLWPGSISGYPEIVHGDTDTIDIAKLAPYLTSLSNIGIVFDKKQEEYLKKLTGMPESEDDDGRDNNEQVKTKQDTREEKPVSELLDE